MGKELYTNVTIEDRSFSIKKFDAVTGLKLARLVISKAAPLLPLIESATGAKQTDEKIYAAVGEILSTLDDKDIEDIVFKCLRVCSELLPAGPAPVIDAMGNYGVDDIEYDMGLTLSLCFEAIKWGASDFFDGKGSILSRVTKSAG